MQDVSLLWQGEAESDAESDNGDSDNDGFFVEHGYLSESEDPMDEDEVSLLDKKLYRVMVSQSAVI